MTKTIYSLLPQLINFIPFLIMIGAMPEINFLFQLFRQRMSKFSKLTYEERKRTLSVFVKGVRASFVLHDIKLSHMFGIPMMNASIFITFIYSIRDMVTKDISEDMDEGGLLWFADLTAKDPTFILPLSAIALSYTALDLSLPTQGKLILFFKDILQSLLLFSVSLVLPLPAGIFCYWIPSSLFTMTQMHLMRNPKIKKWLRIPNIEPPAHLKAPK